MPSSPVRRPLLIRGFKKILHGGDYNPDQWLHKPEVIDEDFRLMELAGCNTFAVGIFSWTSYEREEGKYQFDWLDQIMDRMAGAGSKVFLATPSGAKPAWMSKKYPEIRRVTREGQRETHQTRHNHCWSSPVYREKVQAINLQLATRYAKHPALGGWHISNELNGACYCDLCLKEWHHWLERKYRTLEKLNQAWWASFWSHEFTAWDEIDPRDFSVDAMSLDWMRFNNWQLIDWLQFEADIVRKLTPDVPVTTNFMGLHPQINYADVAQAVDFVTDDQYPCFDIEREDFNRKVVELSFKDDLYRCFKLDRPWMLMESCPDWPQAHYPVRLKSAEVHQLEMLQALAHGAEGTCYFQWRKGAGSWEKFHGAVVDHTGNEKTRVFKSVATLGQHYRKLTELVGTVTSEAEVALIYDWDVKWGFQFSCGPLNRDSSYERVAHDHYQPLWEAGIPVDVLASEKDFSRYRLLILPQLWLLKPDVADRIRSFVRKGGTVVATPYLGICNETNLVFTGGWPGGGLRELFGVWNEETGGLHPDQTVKLALAKKNGLGLKKDLLGRDLLAVLHPEGAQVVASWKGGPFSGSAALTVNSFGKGEAWYVGTRLELESLRALLGALTQKLQIRRNLEVKLPLGVTVQKRTGKDGDYLFFFNATASKQTVPLGSLQGVDMLSGRKISKQLNLAAAGSTIIKL